MVGPLATAASSTIPLVVERLKGLYSAGSIKLWKYIRAADVGSGQELPLRVVPYPEEGALFFGSDDFFTERDFIIEITPKGSSMCSGDEAANASTSVAPDRTAVARHRISESTGSRV
jgi:hypothetical protein